MSPWSSMMFGTLLCNSLPKTNCPLLRAPKHLRSTSHQRYQRDQKWIGAFSLLKCDSVALHMKRNAAACSFIIDQSLHASLMWLSWSIIMAAATKLQLNLVYPDPDSNICTSKSVDGPNMLPELFEAKEDSCKSLYWLYGTVKRQGGTWC